MIKLYVYLYMFYMILIGLGLFFGGCSNLFVGVWDKSLKKINEIMMSIGLILLLFCLLYH